MMRQSEVVPFVFEGAETVRVVSREGEPWFVVADVCRVLNHSNPSKAIDALDEDEKSTINLRNTLTSSEGIQAGNPTVGIASEGGLYTLILRSRDAVTPGSVAHRFRRWVTGEVLPQIRRSGRYDMAADSAKLRQVMAAQKIFGREVASRLWLKLGLTQADGMRLLAQGDLFAGDKAKQL